MPVMNLSARKAMSTTAVMAASARGTAPPAVRTVAHVSTSMIEKGFDVFLIVSFIPDYHARETARAVNPGRSSF